MPNGKKPPLCFPKDGTFQESQCGKPFVRFTGTSKEFDARPDCEDCLAVIRASAG